VRRFAIDSSPRKASNVWIGRFAMGNAVTNELESSCSAHSGCERDSASPWGMGKSSLPIRAFVSHQRRSRTTAVTTGSQPVCHAIEVVLTPTVVCLIESNRESSGNQQRFSRTPETWFDAPPVLTTNTSTLPIGSIGLVDAVSAARCAGWHFFMPVVDSTGPPKFIPNRSTNRVRQRM